MEIFRLRFHIFCLLVVSTLTEATDTIDNGKISDTREPRVTGRIVKLYSGTRPEPILCTGEGFHADPHDCAVFYRCVKSGRGKYTVFRFQCGPGTVYDPEMDVCNHPRSTKRTECGGFSASPPPPDREHMNEIEGVNQEVPSPITTKLPINHNEHITYPKTTTSKQWTTTVKSINKFETSATQKNPDKFVSYPTKPIKSTSAKPIPSTLNSFTASPVHQRPQFTNTRHTTVHSITTSNNRLPSHDNICTTDGFMGDTDDCRKFYRCVGNQRGGYARYEFSCSESTIWDDAIQSCNHAWAVKRSRCGRSNSYKDSFTDSNELFTTDTVKYILESTSKKEAETINTVQQQLQISFGSKVTQTQTQIGNGSVIQNQTQIHYGDHIAHDNILKAEKNQTQVSQNSAVSQTQTQIDYGHKGMQTQLQIDHSQQSSQGQIHIQETSTAVSHSTDSTTSKTKKDSICLESGFMGDSSDCKKFYRCVDDGKGSYTRFEFSCGEGTVWDRKIEACNHAWAVTECGGTTSSENIPQDMNTSTAKPNPHTSTYKSTQNYYTSIPTENYHTTLANTTTDTNTDENNDNGYGNQNIQTNVLSTSEIKTTTTEHSKMPGSECTSSGFMGDEYDCKTFYRCVDNGKGAYAKHEFKCGEGTVWDSNIEACNHAWAVKHCGAVAASTENGKVEETTMKQNTFTQNTDTTTESKVPLNDDYDTGYGSQNNDVSSTTTKTEGQQNLNHNDNTVCKQSGFMGDKNDCKKFYRCVDNGNGDFTRYEFICGEGTVWDPEIEACNHAWAVENCGGAESNTNDHETTSKPQTSTTHVSHSTVSVSTEDNKSTDTTIFISSTSTSTATNLISTEANECKHSGFMGDDKDFKKFYRCVDNGNGYYTRYEFSCGEGTVWDSNIEACNHAWAVDRCGGTTISTDYSQTTVPQYYATEHDEIGDIYGSSTQTQETQYGTSTVSSTMSQLTTEDSKVPNKNNNCKNTGFIGDRNSCQIFYRCVDDGNGGFNRYEFNCGEGTLWDQSIEACNHAWAVKECGYSEVNTSSTTQPIKSTTDITSMTSESNDQGYGQDSEKTSTTGSYQDNDINNICTKEGFMGDKNNCKKFYRCVDDGHGNYSRYEFTCGDGTYWNQDILSCDHATSDKTCKGKDTELTTKIPGHAHDELNTDTTVIQSSTANAIEEAYSTHKPPSSGICNVEGFYGDYSDCKKFYRCVDNGSGSYTKYDFTCGDGTVWDQEIQSCNHDSPNNTCSSATNSIQTSTPQSQTSSFSSFTTESHKTTEKTESSTSSASSQCASEGFFAVPDECKKFIRCVSNDKGGYTKYEFSCGEGTVWVQDILACDHGNSLNCSSQNHQSTMKPDDSEGHSQTSEDPQVQHHSTSHPETSLGPDKYEDEYHSDQSTSQPSGTGKCTSEGFYGHEFDCTRFYRCVENRNGGFTKYDFTCGEGTAWDHEIQSCNHIEQVKTCHGTNQDSTTFLPVMHDENGHTTETTSYSSTSTTTTESSQNTESTDSCTEEGYFGDTKDCSKFYRCVHNGKGGYTKYDYACGDGTIWDQDITTCNHPQDVTNPSCSQSQSESSTSGTTTITTESTSLNSSTTNSTSSSTTESSTHSSSNCSQEETSKNPTTSNINCTKDGYYPNSDDCKKFYRCVDWDGDGKRFSVYHFECGDGTIWDPAVETCNHEESVYPPRNCSGTQSQAENVNQQTTNEGTTTKHEDTTSSQESSTTQSSTTQETNTAGTTTEESSKPEQTTTQQPTSEQTTTQKSDASEQTTTEQTTTSQKPTATEQTTTSEKTTTKKSTTSEQTTQESTTSKQTTTPESITSEQTTQQSTTSEQTTSQQSNTSEPTTEGSTLEQTTTQEPTTTSEQSTQSSTTDQSSQQSTTESSTTQQSTTTTEPSNTEESTSSGGTTESTTEQSTTEKSTTEGSSTTTEESLTNKECPETEDDQYVFLCPTSFKRHPKYCNMFYQCNEDDSHDVKMATFTCPNNTIYDESQTKCVEESNATKKCESEIAQSRRFKRLDLDYKEPIVASKQSYTCPSPGYFSFEDFECSTAFLKCKIDKSRKIRGYVYQCPTGYIYWSISKRCERTNQMVNCKRSSNDWSGRWEIPIERKNVDTS